MAEKPKKEGVSIFVSSMLESAQDIKEVKPQTRYDNVNPAEIEGVMDKIKRGTFRR